jgi:hypothetical protein
MGAKTPTRFRRLNSVNNFYEKSNCKPENILRRPQTPALGFTPAHARARGQDLMDSNSARAGLYAPRPFRRAERISVLTRKFAGL